MSTEPHDQNSAELVRKFRLGDEEAAYELHDRYTNRLLSLVRGRMNPSFKRRMDPEDVVQSAFRSFFRVVSNEEWGMQGGAEKVWSLLAAITLNKLNARMRYHLAGKRSVDSEEIDGESPVSKIMPDTEAIFVDELDSVLNAQLPKHGKILEMLLGGVNETEAAEATGCTTRTVYRVLERAVAQLRSRLGDDKPD